MTNAPTLEQAREIWQYDFEILAPLASTRGVPRPDRPSIKYLARAAEVIARVSINQLTVRAAWVTKYRGPDVSLETLSPDQMLALQRAREQQAAHEAWSAQFEPWRVDDTLEALLPQISEERHAELFAQVESRLGSLLGLGGQSTGPSLGVVGELLRGPRGRPDSIEDYAKLFQHTPLPSAAQTWQRDAHFAWMRLAGPNPHFIRGIERLPDTLPLPDARYRAAIGDEGDSLEAAAKERRLFCCDYSLLTEVVKPGYYEGIPKYLSAPIVLFAVPQSGGPLRAVAIQCDQKPDPEWNPVYTPDDGGSWKLAKAVATAADATHLEMITHLGRTHLFAEVFMLATRRQLAFDHPISQILLPHFEGTTFINNTARHNLVQPGGLVDQGFSGTIESMRALAAKGLATNHFVDCAPPRLLAEAGTERIAEYPYRDDAMLLWRAIEDWARAYAHHQYASDQDVGQDLQLRAWVAQLQKPVSEGGVLGFPSIASREQLATALTRIIFMTSGEHAAVGFAQRTDMAYAPGFSLGWWRPPPRASEQIGDAERLAFMPPLEVARRQVDFLNLIGGVHHTRLGHYQSNDFPYRDWFEDPLINAELLPKFQAALGNIEQAIHTRNLERSWPYLHLLPSTIPMSVNI